LNLAFENDKLMQRSLFFINNTIKVDYPILVQKEKRNKSINPKNWFDNKKDWANYFILI